MTITRDTVMAGKLRETGGHLNYGRDGSGYMLCHTTIRRLQAIDRHYKGEAAKKAGKTAERLWLVDGVQVADLDAAVAALNVPVVLTDEETAALAHIPGDFTERKHVMAAIEKAGPPGLQIISILIALKNKGLIEWSRIGGAGDRPAIPTVRRVPDEDGPAAPRAPAAPAAEAVR
ncbi:hypothetical protein [Methylobacterium aquaticum]|uniref:Uncharacterized protein n=1 Tax=Methylobacterium aquaticum TaxID=270351 RepID=A0A0C6EWF2_9HYPH|nr:hypothetical protein [Methylobacterium aquaticum]BAQ44351.1 hypothetical protein Maq22A_c04705 [Methylobacterium aquaticum]